MIRRSLLHSRQDATPGQRQVRGLRRRPRLRAGGIQLFYIVAGIGLGLVLADIDVGARVDAGRTASLMFAVGGGIISLVAVVFSLLFLVVQYASTTLSPRLNIFRDAPIVWHAFGLFAGIFVLVTTAGLRTSSRGEMSAAVPIVAIFLAVVAMIVARNLQMRAYQSLQIGPTVQVITHRGRAVIDKLYDWRPADKAASPPTSFVADTEVRWHGQDGYIRQVDVPGLLRVALARDGTIELARRPGQFVHHGAVVLRHDMGPDVGELIRHVEIGPDRTFDQDPLLAFRLLVDIGLRAQSPAIHDPETCRHAIEAVAGLLEYVASHDLSIDEVNDADGRCRLMFDAPSWEDYVGAAFDELIDAGHASPGITARLAAALDSLTASTPADRREAIAMRRQQLSTTTTP